MTVPNDVWAVKVIGGTQAIVMVALWLKRAQSQFPPDVTLPSHGHRKSLLIYRLAMLAYCLFIGIRQLYIRGPLALVFFTVWNWWLLTFYFLLSSWASWYAVRHKGKKRGPKMRVLHWVVIAVFHAEAGALLVVDVVTWTVLVPMLLGAADDSKKDYWRERLFCLESYSQHGANFLMMAGDLALNSYPASLWAAGWQGIWASIYGIWSAIFFLTHGRPIYPFMDVKRPNAWVGYAFLVLMAWTAHGTVQAGIALREKVHAWMGLAPKKEG